MLQNENENENENENTLGIERNHVKTSFAICLSIVWVLAACASNSSRTDPFPGSGGLFLGTPKAEDVRSGKAVFDPAKFSSFKLGVTTKREVADSLGQPAWWSTEADGSSSMGYDYVRKEAFFGMQKIERATFKFNSKLVLEKADYPTK